MEDRRDKILDVAIKLAEEGGFENVRQRDVAAQAGVALGTLYKRFRSKEEILSAALGREIGLLERRLERRPLAGETPLDRIVSFFEELTKHLCKRPQYARAIIRAVASGEPEVAGNVMAYHGHITSLIIAAMRGITRTELAAPATHLPNERETTLALLLQQVWFAAMVGWTAKLHGQPEVLTQVKLAGELLSCGLDHQPPTS